MDQQTGENFEITDQYYLPSSPKIITPRDINPRLSMKKKRKKREKE